MYLWDPVGKPTEDVYGNDSEHKSSNFAMLCAAFFLWLVARARSLFKVIIQLYIKKVKKKLFYTLVHR